MTDSTYESWHAGLNSRNENGNAVIDLHIEGNPETGDTVVTVKVGDHESSHTFTENEALMSPGFMADQAISTLVDASNRLIYDNDPGAEEWVKARLAEQEENSEV